MSNLDVLRNFGAIAEELKNKHTPNEYWAKEAKFLDKRNEENEKFIKSIQMSQEKYHQRFDI